MEVNWYIPRGKMAKMAHYGRYSYTRVLIFLLIITIFIVCIHKSGWLCGNAYKEPDCKEETVREDEGLTVTSRRGNETYHYHRDMPLIFIGGVPRSGTTLMRAMIDAHDDVRCGQETILVPLLLGMHRLWKQSEMAWGRFEAAGLTDAVIDDAISAFILELVVKHGEPAPRLCNKDPLTLESMTYLRELFPSAKYILMIRDGRATVHSMVSRKIAVAGFDIRDYKDCFIKWNSAIETMYGQCMQVGPKYCMPVYYEQLVLHPESQMRKIIDFLDLPWDEKVLHHEEAIGKPGGVSLSKVEMSTNQVRKPVNLDALTRWVGRIPQDALDAVPSLAPMLQKLGYDPWGYPPNYGTPDEVVVENTKRIQAGVRRFANKDE